MKPYKIEFTKSASKEFLKLTQQIKDRIISSLQVLATNPYSELIKFKKLKGVVDLYRIRIGDYRVVYEVKNEVLKIVVIKIGHRKEIYRKF